MPKPDPKAVRAALEPIATQIVAGRVLHETLHAEMQALYAELLAEREYTNSYTGNRIVSPKDAWAMSDEDAAIYYPRRDEAVRARYPHLDKDQCPALMAAWWVQHLEMALVAAAEPFFPGLDWHALLCDPKGKGLERLREAIDLLMGLALTAYAA